MRRRAIRCLLNKTNTVSIAMAFSFLLITQWSPASADTANDNEICLGCHSNPTIEGERTKNPHIDPLKFARTTHATIGCSGCHNAIPSVHPDNRKPVSKAHCQDCHQEIQSVYFKGIHRKNAVCSDCHNPHTVRPSVAVSGKDIDNQCAVCHEMALTQTTHAKWLPQALLHMDAVPCISCHTEAKEYVITLFLQKKTGKGAKAEYRIMTNYELGRAIPKGITLAQWIDADKNGTISLAELRNFNRHVRPADVRLWGMLMPEKMNHDFKLILNRRDCSFCHLSGPEARQKSFVAIPEVDGSYSRVDVEKGAVLDVLFGTPDFYMVGSTRSPLVSLLSLLIIISGALFPLIHGTFRFFTRNNRKNSGQKTDERET